MDLRINTIEDLHSEIARLETIKQTQKAAIGERFNGPGATFATLFSMLPASAAVDAVKGQDFVGLLSRFILPLTLNKTIFRHSNFIVKTLVSIASQKASHFISEDSVTGIWGKAKSLINSFTKKDKKPNAKNLQGFGVPPQ